MKPFIKQSDGTWTHPDYDHLRLVPAKVPRTWFKSNCTPCGALFGVREPKCKGHEELADGWLLINAKTNHPYKLAVYPNDLHGYAAQYMVAEGWDAGVFTWADEDNPNYTFRGWATGQTWNGWQMPAFPLEEVDRLIALRAPGLSKLRWSEDHRKVIIQEWECYVDKNCPGCEDCEYTVEEVLVATKDGIEVAWPIGAGAWTWMRVDQQ